MIRKELNDANALFGRYLYIPLYYNKKIIKKHEMIIIISNLYEYIVASENNTG